MYKIIIDSCGELTEELKSDGHFKNVPLEIEINGQRIVDDETFDQLSFLKKVKESPSAPKSSCPAPESFLELYKEEADHIYVVTLSKELSGSYNSAQLAKKLFSEEFGSAGKKIYVFNSRSASVGETLIGMKVRECEESGMTFEETVEHVERYISEQRTFFVLETLETLRKNGRLSGLKALAASALNIKPIMGSTPEGEICQLGQARGMNKALKKMMQEMLASVKNSENRILAISHCNCPLRAKAVKEELLKSAKFKDIVIADTAGISSMYANDGGIIMVV